MVTFGEIFLKLCDTIRPESTRQFNIQILSTIIDNENLIGYLAMREHVIVCN